MGLIFAVHLDGDKDNKLNEQDSINEIYLHCDRHDLPTAETVLQLQRCGEISAVRYLTPSGLQPVLAGNCVFPIIPYINHSYFRQGFLYVLDTIHN